MAFHMSKHVTTQLDKVLALADSNHDGEALVAVRKARQMLSREGLRFSDLARAASQKPRVNLPFGFLSSQNSANLEMEISQLRQELEDLRREKNAAEARTDNWRQRASELEKKLNLSLADAQRWQQLARETVEKLWDLSQSAEEQEPAAEAEVAAKSAAKKSFPSRQKSR
jgi:chromosome segregation ATPase